MLTFLSKLVIVTSDLRPYELGQVIAAHVISQFTVAYRFFFLLFLVIMNLVIVVFKSSALITLLLFERTIESPAVVTHGPCHTSGASDV